MIYLILEVNPEPWAIGDVGIHRRGGKVGAHVGQNVQLKAFQEAVREQADIYLEGQKVPAWPITEDVELVIYLWRQQDRYESSGGKNVRKHRADATNMQKALEDALQGIAYQNDTQVRDVHTVVMAQGPDVQPLIVVGIQTWGGRTLNDLPQAVRFDVQNLFAGNQNLFQAPQPMHHPFDGDAWFDVASGLLRHRP